jgi:ABC-2 type transport system permease protein
MVIVTAALMLAAAIGISIGLNLQPWLGEPEAKPMLALFIGLVAYFLPLFVLISFIWAFASLPVVKEKVNGNIEALMATPLSPRELWLGKTLAIFLPAYIISAITTIVAILAINLTAIWPATGEFALAPPAIVLGLGVNPLLFLGLLLFMLLFSIANNPDIALAPSFILGFGLMMGIPVGMGTGIIDISSWSFVLWYLAGTVLAWIAVLALSPMLTRQNIVLSSKGS